MKELPPRARRIHPKFRLSRPATGTTSACAENTDAPIYISDDARNYLRVRGEYFLQGLLNPLNQELPPRARRILKHPAIARTGIGTTSACAENTDSETRYTGGHWNYLRVRGEYITGTITLMLSWELPPRARRIHSETKLVVHLLGTTSACAENTMDEFRANVQK